MRSTRTRSPSDAEHLVPLTLLALAATVVLVTVGGGTSKATTGSAQVTAASWRGLVGSRPRVSVGQRVIVVLKTPSLAQHVARAGGRATDEQERAWSNAALTAQRLLISRLAVQGVAIHPEYTYTRTLDGFSAAVDPAAIPLLEHDEDVAGVYPVRPAYTAAISSTVLASPEFAPNAGGRPEIGLAGIDGRGVTIALLDTGVDPAVPYLRGRLEPGIDIVGGDPGALAARKPDAPSQLEEHGTEMAGLLVGAGGPSGLAGVATGATILPIRVAGWQQDATGRWAIYSRTDQIIAGLERAVDPNDDGDAHDAARIAVVALAEPYAAFTDGPEARAVAGALALDTLVVAPAGNDGASGPGYGSIAGPGGAGAALTVGAVDTRARIATARVVVRAGLRVLVDRTLPVAGAVEPGRLQLELAAPRTQGAAPPLIDFFARSGASLVAGRAALVDGGASAIPSSEHAAEAGAAAILLYGSAAAPGGLGLDDSTPVPVVSIPTAAARALGAALRAGETATVSIGDARLHANPDAGHVAAFSSSGLAFDGSVKPDVVAPGVGLATSEAGENPDGTPSFATVNGSSAAAATAAGAAALLAQARPGLGAQQLEGLLVGTAAPLGGDAVTSQGAGELQVGAAAAGEVAAAPATIALGRSTGAGWKTKQAFALQNVSTRTIRLTLGVDQTEEGATTVDFSVRPARLLLRRGHTATVVVRAVTSSQPSGTAPAAGYVTARVSGGGTIRVPWTIAFGPASVSLIRSVHISSPSFKPSDAAPALLVVDAGRVLVLDGRTEIRPVSQLDVRLVDDAGDDLGLLARLRDVLPGRYAFGLTGRGPSGGVLPPGLYRLHLLAWPTDGGPPTRRQVSFRIA